MVIGGDGEQEFTHKHLVTLEVPEVVHESGAGLREWETPGGITLQPGEDAS